MQCTNPPTIPRFDGLQASTSSISDHKVFMLVSTNSIFRVRFRINAVLAAVLMSGCVREAPVTPVLNWYVFNEPSGSFAEAARRCAEKSDGAHRVEFKPLPADADQQREQGVRASRMDPALVAGRSPAGQRWPYRFRGGECNL